MERGTGLAGQSCTAAQACRSYLTPNGYCPGAMGLGWPAAGLSQGGGWRRVGRGGNTGAETPGRVKPLQAQDWHVGEEEAWQGEARAGPAADQVGMSRPTRGLESQGDS